MIIRADGEQGKGPSSAMIHPHSITPQAQVLFDTSYNY